MKRRLKILLLILTGAISMETLSAAAPPVKSWQKCLGGSLQDVPASIIQSNDGNLLLLSNTDSNDGDVLSNNGSTDIWLTKLTPGGSVLWQKTFGGAAIDVGTSLIELPDGKIAIAGYTASATGIFAGNKGAFDAFLIIANSNGNVIRSNTYGGTLVDLCYSLAYSNDGGFILGGGSYSNDRDVSGNHGDQDMWIVKVDSLGNIQWQNSTGGPGIDVCYSLKEDASGNIYAAGTSNSTNGNIQFSHGSYDLWVVKFNRSGGIVWNKTYGGTDYETAQTLIIDSRQNVLVGGYSRSCNGDVSTNHGYSDSWLIRIASNGNLLSEKNFGGSGSDNLFSIIETSDGGYLLTSGTTSSNFDVKNHLGMEDIWLFKMDINFVSEWSRNYGGSGSDRPVCSIQNASGGFYIAGYTFSNNIDVSGNHGTCDIWLLDLECSQPSAYFSTNNSYCIGDSLTLISASQNASSVEWFINYASYSELQSASVAFGSPGFYNVSLSVQTCYSYDSYSTDLNLIDCRLPQISFSSNSTKICSGMQAEFQDASLNASSWAWSFPGGIPSASSLQNPVVVYNTPGNYSVMLTVTNSFGSQSSMRLNYISVSEAPSIPVVILSGNELRSTPGEAYQWYYNNAPIPTATTQTFMAFLDGNYKVIVTNANGCSNESLPVYFSATGISNNDLQEGFKVYPNVVTKTTSIRIPGKTEGTIQLVSFNGQLLVESAITGIERVQEMNLASIPTGIYKMLFITDDGKVYQQSIIKQ